MSVISENLFKSIVSELAQQEPSFFFLPTRYKPLTVYNGLSDKLTCITRDRTISFGVYNSMDGNFIKRMEDGTDIIIEDVIGWIYFVPNIDMSCINIKWCIDTKIGVVRLISEVFKYHSKIKSIKSSSSSSGYNDGIYVIKSSSGSYLNSEFPYYSHDNYSLLISNSCINTNHIDDAHVPIHKPGSMRIEPPHRHSIQQETDTKIQDDINKLKQYDKVQKNGMIAGLFMGSYTAISIKLHADLLFQKSFSWSTEDYVLIGWCLLLPFIQILTGSFSKKIPKFTK